MSAPSAPVLVLGIGSVLAGDDGVGPRVVAALEAERARGGLDLPRLLELADGGTLGSDLLPWLAEARAAVLVDAADVGGPAGSIAVWRDVASAVAPPEAPGVPRPEARPGIADLLAAARSAGALPAAISIVGIQPADLSACDRLSPAVEAALPAAVALAAAEARRLDARTGEPAAATPPHDEGARA